MGTRLCAAIAVVQYIYSGPWLLYGHMVAIGHCTGTTETQLQHTEEVIVMFSYKHMPAQWRCLRRGAYKTGHVDNQPSHNNGSTKRSPLHW